jgi:purine-nucleoside phosphorylase
MVSRADSALGRPTSSVPCSSWRWRFEKSTVSKSTIPSLPMPAAARYIAMGDPKPPAPMHSTLVEQIFFCPAMPTSGRMRWREYRRISSFDSCIVMEAVVSEACFSYEELPGFVPSRVPGHRGELMIGQLGGAPVAVLSGRAHYYEGHDLHTVTFPMRVLSALGVRSVLLTNAAGGIRPGLEPGDWVALTDHLNFIGTNPLRGPGGAERFVDLSEVYSPLLRGFLRHAADQTGLKLQEGVYAAVSGPSYETPAEVRALARLGADLVGMSTVPEAIVARQCRMDVAGLSCVTNKAAGLGGNDFARRSAGHRSPGGVGSPALDHRVREDVRRSRTGKGWESGCLRPRMRDHESSGITRSEPEDARAGSAFLTTRWTLVVGSQGRDTTVVRRALEELCQTYWRPVHAFIRRRGHAVHEAQDLTQEFFARLLASDGLQRADPARGRFRSFLLSAVKHFLANEWDKARTLKRGGGEVSRADPRR